jgi:hypothetical protein
MQAVTGGREYPCCYATAGAQPPPELVTAQKEPECVIFPSIATLETKAFTDCVKNIANFGFKRIKESCGCSPRQRARATVLGGNSR